MQDHSSYKENLHHDASRQIKRFAGELRHNETEAEKKLWQFLRNRKLVGRKFRRQHPFDKYILDFYCHECKLGIELDGKIHDHKMINLYDQARTTRLEDLDLTIIRFRNEEVMNEIEKVLEIITKYLE